MNSNQNVAVAALMGNLDYNVVKRMAIFIINCTTDSTIISNLLNGLIVDAKIKDEKRLIELLSNCVNENITKIISLDVNVEYQNVSVTFVYKRFAKTANEIQSYNTKRVQDDTYNYEVEIQDTWQISISDFNFEDSIEFETI